MRQFSLRHGDGRYRMEAAAALSEGGLSVYVCGGDAPHIGAAVLAQPRPSLSGQGVSCTSSVLNLPGHKDEAFARPLAERLCKAAELPVCVCVGVHVDRAAEADLRALGQVFQELSDQLVHAVLSGG